MAKLLGPTSSGMPPYVWIKPYGGGFKAADAGFLGAKYGALALGDGKPPENLLPAPSVRSDELELRDELRARFNRRYATGRPARNVEADSHVFDLARTLMKRADLFDDSTFSDRDRERYGTHELGRHLLLARRTLEAGVRFVKVNSYHWDSHGDNFNACDSLIPQFDRPFAALIEDLHERGMLDNVLVIVMSEFGRTPKINSHVGRDHWPRHGRSRWRGPASAPAWSSARPMTRGRLSTEVARHRRPVSHLVPRAGGADREDGVRQPGQPLPVAHEGCAAISELLA